MPSASSTSVHSSASLRVAAILGQPSSLRPVDAMLKL
jgi:hypothetical protein